MIAETPNATTRISPTGEASDAIKQSRVVNANPLATSEYSFFIDIFLHFSHYP